jgi:hypothetical protein
MTNVIFLQASEFSGQQAKPNNYENSHKNIFGLSYVLELKVKKLDPFLVTKYIKKLSK